RDRRLPRTRCLPGRARLRRHRLPCAAGRQDLRCLLPAPDQRPRRGPGAAQPFDAVHLSPRLDVGPAAQGDAGPLRVVRRPRDGALDEGQDRGARRRGAALLPRQRSAGVDRQRRQVGRERERRGRAVAGSGNDRALPEPGRDARREVAFSRMTDTRPHWRVAPYFIVDDVVATANYYRDTLGFLYERFWGDPPAFTMVRRRGVVIMLGQLAPAGTAGLVRPNSGAVEGDDCWDAYVWVDDADALYAEFQANGVRI